MRSRHADRFNHDDSAVGYDRDVQNESHPIRAGYGALLSWVADRAEIGPASSVLELGAGTGNLTAKLIGCERILCVDVSEDMLAIARTKLAGLHQAVFLRADLLECFDGILERFDTVVSTYAIHHLEPEEKSNLFRYIAKVLERGGRAVFGDLMFEDEAHEQRFLAGLREAGKGEVADEIAEEFFWNAERASQELVDLGFQVTVKRFSELSFGLLADGRS